MDLMRCSINLCYGNQKVQKRECVAYVLKVKPNTVLFACKLNAIHVNKGIRECSEADQFDIV